MPTDGDDDQLAEIEAGLSERDPLFKGRFEAAQAILAAANRPGWPWPTAGSGFW